MFLNKFDSVGLETQKQIFYPKYITTPFVITWYKIGVYEYYTVLIFGLRIALIAK